MDGTRARELFGRVASFDHDFADVALMSPVPGRGLSTPALVSGSGATEFADLINERGGRVEVVATYTAMLYERGQFDRAVSLYDEALATPDVSKFVQASIYSDRGVAKWRMKQTREAVDDFNESIQLSPESATVYNNRGNALMDLGHPEEALMREGDEDTTIYVAVVNHEEQVAGPRAQAAASAAAPSPRRKRRKMSAAERKDPRRSGLRRDGHGGRTRR